MACHSPAERQPRVSGCAPCKGHGALPHACARRKSSWGTERCRLARRHSHSNVWGEKTRFHVSSIAKHTTKCQYCIEISIKRPPLMLRAFLLRSRAGSVVLHSTTIWHNQRLL